MFVFRLLPRLIHTPKNSTISHQIIGLNFVKKKNGIVFTRHHVVTAEVPSFESENLDFSTILFSISWRLNGN